ncbi:MAG: AI-2E family transporter [Porticoccaceae bacterium]
MSGDARQPQEPRREPVALRWLLALALVYTLYFGRTLLIPAVVALLLALLLSPPVAVLKRFYIPRAVSAILVLGAICGPFALLSMELAEPAQKWAKRLPELSSHLSQQFDAFAVALQPEKVVIVAEESAQERRGFGFFGLFRDDPRPAPSPQVEEKPAVDVVSEKIVQSGMDVMVAVLAAAPMIITQLLTCVILTLFLLIFGPKLFNVAVTIFPRPENRGRIVDIVTTIRNELSRYILTVSLINFLLGAVTGAALWWLGVEDALLWGVLAGLLNYAPYVGPVIAVLVLCIAGFAQYGAALLALMPATVYFVFNLLEAQFLTPTVLGVQMQLNPLVLVVWLFIWGWLWGIAGVLLAVPLLVSLKIAAQRLGVLTNWTRLAETDP